MSELMKKVEEPQFSIRASGNLTAIQQKAWVLLYLNAKNALDVDFHYIPLAEVSNSIKVHYDQELRDALLGLGQTTVEWDVFGDDGSTTGWAMSSMIAFAVINENVLKYEFSKGMKDLLLSNPFFAQLDFPTLIAFRGKHAIKLWRYCSLFKDTLTGSTGWKTVEGWRAFFGLEPTMYREFKTFKRDVIGRAIDEINKVALFQIKAEYKREGRTITEIRFLQIRNTKEVSRQINEAIEEAENIPPQFAWYNKQTKFIQIRLQAEFESICKVEDPHQRQIEWGQYLVIKRKKSGEQRDLFMR